MMLFMLTYVKIIPTYSSIFIKAKKLYIYQHYISTSTKPCFYKKKNAELAEV